MLSCARKREECTVRITSLPEQLLFQLIFVNQHINTVQYRNIQGLSVTMGLIQYRPVRASVIGLPTHSITLLLGGARALLEHWETWAAILESRQPCLTTSYSAPIRCFTSPTTVGFRFLTRGVNDFAYCTGRPVGSNVVIWGNNGTSHLSEVIARPSPARRDGSSVII